MPFLVAILTPAPDTPTKLWADIVSVIGGIVLYGAFVMYLHRLLIGVPVIPG